MNINSIGDTSDERVKYWQQMAEEYPYCNVAQFMSHFSKHRSVNPVHKYLYHFHPTLVALNFNSLGSEPATITQSTPPSKETSIPLTHMASVDYYRTQGIEVSDELPDPSELTGTQEGQQAEGTDSDKSLLVQMTFAEWLKKITETKRKEREEELEKEALRLKWKQEKLAAAIQEETDDIPDQVFQMAVESITQEDVIPSESLAEVYLLQNKKEKAIQIYQKLILLNPEKKIYFANKIEQIQKSI